MNNHRWSGWPGAWCMDCGIEDALEVCLSLGHDPENRTCDCKNPGPCPEPGSGRFDPYKTVEAAREAVGKLEEKEAVLAESKEVGALDPYVRRVLSVVAKHTNPGAARAWVSDLSSFWDFLHDDVSKHEGQLAAISKDLGFAVSGKTLIHEAAVQVRGKQRGE